MGIWPTRYLQLLDIIVTLLTLI